MHYIPTLNCSFVQLIDGTPIKIPLKGVSFSEPSNAKFRILLGSLSSHVTTNEQKKSISHYIINYINLSSANKFKKHFGRQRLYFFITL